MYFPIALNKREVMAANYWEGFSRKINRDVNFTNQLSYDFWILVETDPEIIDYCERPLEIKRIFNQKTYKARFDMWIKMTDGQEVFIKILNSGSEEKHFFLREWCKEKNFKIQFIRKEDVYKNLILFNNKKRLIPFVTKRSTPIEMDQYLVMKFIDQEKTKIGTILNRIEGKITGSRFWEILYWLIYLGKINADIDHKILGPETVVWKNGK